MLKAVRTALIVILNIIFYGLVIFAGVRVVDFMYDFAYETLGDTSVELPPGQEKEVTLTSSQSEFDVAEMLAEKDIVKNKYSFYLRMQIQKEKESAIEPGTYILNTSMNYEEILREIFQVQKVT